MQLEFLRDNARPDAPAIALITPFADGDGVEVSGNGRHDAAKFIDALRPPLLELLGRDPNGDELIEAALATASPRIRVKK